MQPLFRQSHCGLSNKNTKAVRNLYLASGLMAVSDEPKGLGVWSLVLGYIAHWYGILFMCTAAQPLETRCVRNYEIIFDKLNVDSNSSLCIQIKWSINNNTDRSVGVERHALGIKTAVLLTVISGFRWDVDEICALPGYYAASSGNPLPTFRDNVSVPFSRVKKSGLIDRWGWYRYLVPKRRQRLTTRR